ncbi:MAG: class I SAM-dependent RNA methyltransferase [Deltaproteobacteria bacterium]|nr:class I SAM-dependent RNA methyltransferase [Deltaproteobacteria bacterium]
MNRSSEPVTIKIEKLVFGGLGMGKLDGKPVFVPFVLPNETVRVIINKRKRQYLEAELVEVLEPAPERVIPPCPYFGKCGGCQWQQMNYETQLVWKEKIVRETLERTGKVENPKVLPTIPSPKNLGWRNRVTLHSNERGELGFFAPNSHRVIDIEKCLIVDDSINAQIEQLRTQSKFQKRDFSLTSACENETGPAAPSLSVSQRDPSDRDSASPVSFSQVNTLQNLNLKNLLYELVQQIPHDTIVELFCGGGNLTEQLIPLAKKLIAIDCDKAAIESAQKRWPGVEWICSDAVRYFAQTHFENLDLLVLDPPRDGAGGVVEGVIKSKPKNILYISCNPATLSRDIKYLKDFTGYTLVQSQPIDMFPHSYHIESLSWLAKP